MNGLLRKQILQLFTEQFTVVNRRTALLNEAFADDSDLVQQVDLTGPVDEFSINLLGIIIRFGKLSDGTHALEALLVVFKTKYGLEKKAIIEEIIIAFREKKSAASDPSVPQLPSYILPYLADRSEQHDSILAAMQRYRHRGDKNGRPLVCLIYGDPRECHFEFVRRMEKVMMPGMLKADHEDVGPDVKGITLKKIDLAASDAGEQLQKQLGYAFGKLDTPDKATIHEDLDNLKRPILVSIPVSLTSSLQDFHTWGAALAMFFNDKWENFPSWRPLVICLKYEVQELVTSSGWLSRRRAISPEAICRFLAENKNMWDLYPTFNSLIVPELCSITRQEILSWVQSPEVSAHVNVDRLMRAVKKWLSDKQVTDNNTPICMEDAVAKFEFLIEEFC